jgi:hypothetical protein
MKNIKKLFLTTLLITSLSNFKSKAMEVSKEGITSIWDSGENQLYIIKDDGVVIPVGPFPKDSDAIQISGWSQDKKYLHINTDGIDKWIGPFPSYKTLLLELDQNEKILFITINGIKDKIDLSQKQNH